MHFAKWQRNKTTPLDHLQNLPIGQVNPFKLTKAALVHHVKSRRETGAGSATVSNNLAHVQAHLRRVRPQDRSLLLRFTHLLQRVLLALAQRLCRRHRIAVFPNLKPSTKTISLRLPQHLLDAIKTAANARDVPYQSLINVWLQEKVQRG